MAVSCGRKRCSSVAICGVWMAALIVGVYGDCPSPPRLDSGELTDESLTVTAFPVGTTLTYRCRPGYGRTPGKTNSITCLAINAWSEIQEFCERRNCGSPGEPLNGAVVLSKIPGTDEPDTKFGATATFTCNVGFRLVGRNVRTCTASGWNNAVPSCEAVICASPPSIANGGHSDSDKTEFQYNSTVRYSCKDDTFTLLGNAVLSCTQYGNWSGPPPTCTVISCSNPSVANAVKTAGFGSGPFNYRDSITFECNKGFTMKGQATVTCSESSAWSPALPTCVKVAGDCPSPPRLDYGFLTDASLTVTAFPVDTTLTYRCRPGYVRMPGKTNSITCLATNAWSEIQEFCQRRDCGNPGELQNGVVVLSTIPGTDLPDTKLGATAKFVCNKGYRLIGRSVRTCRSMGWNNAVPICEDLQCPPRYLPLVKDLTLETVFATSPKDICTAVSQSISDNWDKMRLEDMFNHLQFRKLCLEMEL